MYVIIMGKAWLWKDMEFDDLKGIYSDDPVVLVDPEDDDVFRVLSFEKIHGYNLTKTLEKAREILKKQTGVR